MKHLPTLRMAFRRWDALAFALAVRLALSTVIGLPIVGALLATEISHHPDGDSALFGAGGLMLTEAVRLSLDGLGALTQLTLLLTVLALLVSLVPVAVLLHALADQDLPLPQALARGMGRLPTLFAIYALCLLLQVLVVAGTLILAVFVTDELGSTLTDPQADLCGVSLFSLGLLLNCCIGITRDLAFAAATGSQRNAWRALFAGAGALLAHPLRVGVDWARFAAWQGVVVLGAAWLVGVIPVDSGSTSSATLSAGLQLGVLTSIIVLRAAWTVRSLAHARADGIV